MAAAMWLMGTVAIVGHVVAINGQLVTIDGHVVIPRDDPGHPRWPGASCPGCSPVSLLATSSRIVVAASMWVMKNVAIVGNAVHSRGHAVIIEGHEVAMDGQGVPVVGKEVAADGNEVTIDGRGHRWDG